MCNGNLVSKESGKKLGSRVMCRLRARSAVLNVTIVLIIWNILVLVIFMLQPTVDLDDLVINPELIWENASSVAEEKGSSSGNKSLRAKVSNDAIEKDSSSDNKLPLANVSNVKIEEGRSSSGSPPEVPPVARGGGLSACLLVKDENHNLPEWIAYHYHTYPLRYLVVAVDPSSVTSPSHILARWNSSDLGMEVMEWNDDWYMPEEIRGELHPDAPKADHIERHRDRQNWFYGKCLRQHRDRNRTWTILIDVDEYLLFNTIEDDECHFEKTMTNETGVAASKYLVTDKAMKMYAKKTWKQQKMKARTRLPAAVGEKTVAEFLNEEKGEIPWRVKSCVVLNRLTFGNAEEDDEEILHRHIPTGFDPKHFNTLRFFRHATKGKLEENKYGKAIIDVSRISEESASNRTRQVHTPIKECGYTNSAFAPYYDSILRVNHYSMSKEAFFSKSDLRRSEENYKWRAEVSAGVMYSLQPWLQSFVDEVGLEKARELLEGAGNFEDWRRKDKL